MKKIYIKPLLRLVDVGTERNTCQLVIGGSEDPDAPQLVREQDDDLWVDETKQIAPSSSNVWDNAW